MDDTTEEVGPRARARPRATGFVFDGKQKVTMTLAGGALLLAGAIGLHAFLARHTSTYFVRSASAQTTHDEVTAQIRDISDAAKSAAQAAQQAIGELRSHVAGEELKEARNKIDQLRGEISATRLWESTNGENDVSRARRRDLENQLERTRAYVECLEAGRSSCQP